MATSTGGLTNKLPCRIGDTPTIGAGFWAEEWNEDSFAKHDHSGRSHVQLDVAKLQSEGWDTLNDYLPPGTTRHQGSPPSIQQRIESDPPSSNIHALALSGSGNGDAFLKLAAARTVGAIVRFSSGAKPQRTLASAISQVAGPGGELQQSAEERWGNGDGEGGIIGIELKNGNGEVVYDFNCGGLFRCWGDEEDRVRVGVFRETDVLL